MFRLDGKVALVTGAGRGAALGIIRTLAQQGAHVVVNDIDSVAAVGAAEALRTAGGRATPAVFDVTVWESVRAGVAQVVRDVGPVDILVNNAGNAGSQAMQLKLFVDMVPADWQPFIAVNLLGVLHCTHAVLRGMCERRWGRVITISSGSGLVARPPGGSLYGAAKAGGAHFMRHLSQEVARSGVTANVISLGMMNHLPEEYTKPVVNTIPIGRLGTPEDIGAAVLFLASEEAGWITGATLAVDGGGTAK
jgi:NAD(P)-dependent dehydrogenase (short-subunit alcohol dehydrogenase family)